MCSKCGMPFSYMHPSHKLYNFIKLPGVFSREQVTRLAALWVENKPFFSWHALKYFVLTKNLIEISRFVHKKVKMRNNC